MHLCKIFLRLVGLLLLTAAALKIHGLAVAPVSAIGFFSESWVQVAIVHLELLLGLWFLSVKALVMAWITAIFLFAGFATVSFYQAAIGVASCGCFGAIQLNPEIAFLFDLGIVGVLARFPPEKQLIASTFGQSMGILLLDGMWIGTGMVVLMGVLVGFGLFWFGSLDSAVAFLRGDLVSVQPGIVDLGSAPSGEFHQADVRLTNRMEKPVTLFGGTSDCSCLVTANLPATLMPGESVKLSLTMRFPHEPGRFTRSAIFLGDADGWMTIPVQLSGVSSGTIIPAGSK